MLIVKALFTSAVRQPHDRLRLELQGIRKGSYGCRTNSQCRTIDRNVQGGFRHTHFSCDLLAICLDRTAAVRIRTAVLRNRTGAVRTTYEINNDRAWTHVTQIVRVSSDRRTAVVRIRTTDARSLSAYLVVVIILH